MATIDVVLPRDSNHFAADFAELNIASLEGDSSFVILERDNAD
jgi:hypothetical protein